MNTAPQINDIIGIGGQLTELLEHENAALRDHRAGEIAGRVEEKRTLVRTYDARLRGLGGEDSLLADADPGLVARLRDTAATIATLAKENASLLDIAMKVNQRFLDVVAEAVKDARAGAGTYSNQGIVGAEPRGKPRNIAISLDQSL